jgi:hypothetical protein
MSRPSNFKLQLRDELGQYSFSALAFSLLALSIWSLYRLLTAGRNSGLPLSSHKMQLVIAVSAAFCLIDLVSLVSSFLQNGSSGYPRRILGALYPLGKFNFIPLGLLISGFGILMFGPTSDFYRAFFIRTIVYLHIVFIGTFLLKASIRKLDWSASLACSALLMAFTLSAGSYLAAISTNPYSLRWSEGSQYYQASLFWAKRIYGVQLSWPVLNPSKYLLQSIPFIIPNSPIWLHRSWEAILWISTPLLTGWALVRRLHISGRVYYWMLIVWMALFLMIGAIYYHLLLCVLLILVGFYPAGSGKRAWLLSLCTLIIASIWAGLSRVNWIVVPGLLASSLYFIENGLEGKSAFKYTFQGLSWALIGGLVAAISSGLYILNSGNPPLEFTSSLTSQLLWNRLLPNPTFGPGILPAILFVSLPLLAAIAQRLIRENNPYGTLRVLILSGYLLVLFIGGLIASVKIGAGSNLHNLDAYMLLLLIIAAYIYYDCAAKDYLTHSIHTHLAMKNPTNRFTMAYTLFMPLLFSLAALGPAQRVDSNLAAGALDVIQKFSNKAASSGGEVLFITERQLLTFHEIRDVPIVEDYEKFFLMEMAMSGNRKYMDQFYSDLEKHRFALIITEPIFLSTDQENGKFTEEDRVWREKVNDYLNCYYKTARFLREVNIYILEPRLSLKNQCP